VPELAAVDDRGAGIDGACRIFEPAMGTAMAHAQLRDLGGTARSRVLIAPAAGLRVIQRSKSIGNLFDLVELGVIHGVRGVVHYSVAFVVKACRCFGKGRSKSTEGESQNEHTTAEFHEHIEAGQGTPTVTYPSKKTKRKTRAGPAGKPGQVQSETTESKDAPLSDR